MRIRPTPYALLPLLLVAGCDQERFEQVEVQRFVTARCRAIPGDRTPARPEGLARKRAEALLAALDRRPLDYLALAGRLRDHPDAKMRARAQALLEKTLGPPDLWAGEDNGKEGEGMEAAADLGVLFGCHSGVCGKCATTVLAGV